MDLKERNAKKQRIIIGEVEHSGWPLSQPWAETGAPVTKLRFVSHPDSGYFCLEFLDDDQQWKEVPVVEKPPISVAAYTSRLLDEANQ